MLTASSGTVTPFAVRLICAIAFHTGSKSPRRMADGACNSAASPIVFFRNSDQQIETDHGRFEYGRRSSRGNSAGRTTKCVPNNLLGSNEKFQRAIEGRHSPHGSMGAGLPWGPFCWYCHGDHADSPAPRAAWLDARAIFRKAAGMSPISCLVGMARHSWWHRNAIAAAHSQRGRHDHRAGQLQLYCHQPD
jgi:hypothetical protein